MSDIGKFYVNSITAQKKSTDVPKHSFFENFSDCSHYPCWNNAYLVLIADICRPSVAVIEVEPAINIPLFKRHTNETKGSIKSSNDLFTSFACQTADNCDKSYTKLFTTLKRYANYVRWSNGEKSNCLVDRNESLSVLSR